MEVKKVLAGGILILTVTAVGYQVYCIDKKRRALNAEYEKKTLEYTTIEAENGSLQDKLDYYAEEHNLEKELRARYNYRAPEEKMIIVVPQGAKNEE